MGSITKGTIGEQDIHRWDGTSDMDFTRDTSTGGTITLNDFGHEVDLLITYGAGKNYTLATLQSALTAIGSTNKVTLVLRPGTWAITDDITVTSNIHLKPAAGCKFTVSSGKTATIEGTVEAGPYQWIYGTGTTTISTYPQDQAWWGSTERLDVTGLKVGSNVVSAFIKTLLDDATGIAARSTLGFTEQSLINVGLSASVSAKALTVALKGSDGNAPSATNPVVIGFRNATLTTGTVVVRTITGATSVVLSSGSTLGFTSALAGRIYVWALDNAGTVVLGLSRTADIFPEGNVVSTTAEGGAGAADSASVMYSTSGQTNVPCRLLGYIEITTGATAGEWDNAPTKVQIMGPGVKRTGDIVQTVSSFVSAVATGTTVLPGDNTIPQIGEGDQYLTKAITPTSAVNKIRVTARLGAISSSAANAIMGMALFNGADDAIATSATTIATATHAKQMGVDYIGVAGGTTAITYSVRAGAHTAGTTTVNGSGGTGYYNSTISSCIIIQEIFE
jgi:hypothetical protein